ncbi:hypothetical protein D3C85_944780 [compost metagenome]
MFRPILLNVIRIRVFSLKLNLGFPSSSGFFSAIASTASINALNFAIKGKVTYPSPEKDPLLPVAFNTTIGKSPAAMTSFGKSSGKGVVLAKSAGSGFIPHP